MFFPGENFHDVNRKQPENDQRVIAYNSKLDRCIECIYKNGKFYEKDNVLENITGWKEINNNITF